MSEHDHDELQANDRRPRRPSVDGTVQPSGSTMLPANSALARLLGGGIDRATTRTQGAGPLDEGIASDISSARGGGDTIDDATRTDMESHLGVDLSGVRVHTGSEADKLSRSVQAEAFTTGSDIFFRSGRYQPGSSDGRRLLAHELTHVVQQSSGGGGQTGRVSHPDDPHEREASAVGDAVAASAPATAPTTDAPSVAREASTPDEETEETPDRQATPEDETEETPDRQATPEDETEETPDRQATPEDETEEEPAG